MCDRDIHTHTHIYCNTSHFLKCIHVVVVIIIIKYPTDYELFENTWMDNCFKCTLIIIEIIIKNIYLNITCTLINNYNIKNVYLKITLYIKHVECLLYLFCLY